MKKGILLLLLVSSVFAKAQSLKEALYSGKLKNDPGTVIRKGEDLTSKIDTTTRKPVTNDVAITPTAPVTADTSTRKVTTQTDSAAFATTEKKDTNTSLRDTTTVAVAAPTSTLNEVSSAPAAPKDNNVLWKEYVDPVVSTLKSEVLTSKKIKRGTYYVLVSYTIETDGQVAIGDVFVTPENAFLQQQVKERLSLNAPRLSPVLNSSGTPRKVTKKYNITLTKE